MSITMTDTINIAYFDSYIEHDKKLLTFEINNIIDFLKQNKIIIKKKYIQFQKGYIRCYLPISLNYLNIEIKLSDEYLYIVYGDNRDVIRYSEHSTRKLLFKRIGVLNTTGYIKDSEVLMNIEMSAIIKILKTKGNAKILYRKKKKGKKKIKCYLPKIMEIVYITIKMCGNEYKYSLYGKYIPRTKYDSKIEFEKGFDILNYINHNEIREMKTIQKRVKRIQSIIKRISVKNIKIVRGNDKYIISFDLPHKGGNIVISINFRYDCFEFTIYTPFVEKEEHLTYYDVMSTIDKLLQQIESDTLRSNKLRKKSDKG